MNPEAVLKGMWRMLKHVSNHFSEIASYELEYPKVEFKGKTWEIISREGPRLQLRRRVPQVLTLFKWRITVYIDVVVWVKKVNGELMSIPALR